MTAVRVIFGAPLFIAGLYGTVTQSAGIDTLAAFIALVAGTGLLLSVSLDLLGEPR